MNRPCPQCHTPYAFEWRPERSLGWCLECGYFVYYNDEDDFWISGNEVNVL